MTKYFVDINGNYIGGFDGVEPPAGAIEVNSAPDDARQIWDGSAWGSVPLVIPDSVSRRQFMLQLAIAGLTSEVNDWISSQDELVQIAFNESGSFVRTEPMMQQGLTGLGFTSEQIDEFFLAASKL